MIIIQWFIFAEEKGKANDDDEDKTKDLQAKKAKLKSAFDAEYDQSTDPDSKYLDDLKKEVEIQTKVNWILPSFSFLLISTKYSS